MSDPDIPLETSLAFEVKKQSAILGWCLLDAQFCGQCVGAVKAEWFSSPNVSKLYGAVATLYTELGRAPTPQELKSYRPFTLEEASRQQKLTEALADALKLTKVYKLDLLRKEMTSWMHAVIFYQSFSQAQVLYNAKKVEEAWKCVEDASLMKVTGTFEDGVNQGFRSALDRLRNEREERVRQSKLVLPYGVMFLDDALGGIIPNDLIVLGAKTGAGKTALATSIALSVAEQGHPVHYFALEAEDAEIERRIKYGLLSTAHYRNRSSDPEPVRYLDWRMGRLESVLGRYEEEVEATLAEKLKNLNTLYRTSGDFTLAALEKSLRQIIGKTRLVIIDHLHYIDTDKEEENVAYKATMKLVRDMVLRFNIPIVVVAHLRKNQGGYKSRPLVNGVEDFHGTSDVPKISTTCIMIGPAYDQIADASYLWPTYINVGKSRLDGGITRYTGLCQFDQRSSKYSDLYQLGFLSSMREKWEEITESNQLPSWGQPLEVRTDKSI